MNPYPTHTLLGDTVTGSVDAPAAPRDHTRALFPGVPLPTEQQQTLAERMAHWERENDDARIRHWPYEQWYGCLFALALFAALGATWGRIGWLGIVAAVLLIAAAWIWIDAGPTRAAVRFTQARWDELARVREMRESGEWK